MAYSKNSPITAFDYNAFAGLTNVAAISDTEAQYKAGYLWGVGYGDRGYGQTTPTLTTAARGGNIGQEWANLRTIIANLASWQNTSTTILPPASAFVAGQPIVAHESDAPSSNAYDLADMMWYVDSNRLFCKVANMSLSTGIQLFRSGFWSTTISCTAQMTFANEDEARYFFNTGGQLRVLLAHPSTGTPQDVAWNTMLSNLTLSMGAHSTTRTSGSVGTGSSIGYYELESYFQNIFSGVNVGSGAYVANDVYVAARTVQTSYTNGGKGYQIQLRVTLVDDHVNSHYDTVSGGTEATFQQYRAAAGGVSVNGPTFSQISAWA